VIKVEKAWSWLNSKVRGSESGQKHGPPYKPLQPIPEPKPRSKAHFTLVVIGQSGASRQIEVTPLRLRVGIVALCVVLAAGVLAIGGAGRFFSGKSRHVDQNSELSRKIASLQEELRTKETQLAVQESRLKELQELSLPSVRRSGTSEPASSSALPSGGKTAPKDDGPLTALPPASSGPGIPSAAAEPAEEEDHGIPSGPPVASGARPAERSPLTTDADAASPGEQTASAMPVVNFNAQQVSASAEKSNKGILSFRLVKDQPEFRFTGYLFVILEMEDPRGENKIYAYPGKTSLGDEYLPSNYREGETLSFKFKQGVELPYEDIRPDASLTRVSVLLYGEDGKIVFQRGFDRKEIKKASGGGQHKMHSPRTKASEKRRAL
jgi:hypothetical protein